MATQVATTSPRPTTPAPIRPDTPARWQAALTRARDERVSVRQLAGCGGWIATSTTDPTVAYEVTPWECECHAGQHGDPICKHRALLRCLLGYMHYEPDPEPEPPAPVVVILRQPETPCHNCQGHGWGYGTVSSGRLDRVTCWTCDGTGVEPSTLIVA